MVSIAAYVLWFARGILRAGGITALFETWRRDPEHVKGELLATLPGVTTLTQLAVAAIPLAIAFKLVRPGSAIRVLVVVVFALAVVRTALFSERLALIELLLPLAFLIAAPRKVTVPRIALYALAFLLAAITFFAATELRRSYAYTSDFSASRATTRFFGYYLTSVNNGMAVVDEYPASTPFYWSGEFLWRLPVVGDLRVEHLPGIGTVNFRYADAFGIDPESFWFRAVRRPGPRLRVQRLHCPRVPGRGLRLGGPRRRVRSRPHLGKALSADRGERLPSSALRRLARRPLRVHADPLLHEHADLPCVSRLPCGVPRPAETCADACSAPDAGRDGAATGDGLNVRARAASSRALATARLAATAPREQPVTRAGRTPWRAPS